MECEFDYYKLVSQIIRFENIILNRLPTNVSFVTRYPIDQ